MKETLSRYAPLMLRVFHFTALTLLAVIAAPAAAQEEKVPYWASIRVDKVNSRVGPAITYRIAWVYKRRGLPVKVLRREEGWRLVEDPDGAQGWMLGRFLSLDRTAYVQGSRAAEMRQAADPTSRLLWQLEPGIVVELGDCQSGWCLIKTHGRSGFVREASLWGAGRP